MLLAGGVGKCCGRLKCFRICIGKMLNLTCLKLKIVGLIMS